MKFVVRQRKGSKNVDVQELRPDGRRVTWELLMTDTHTARNIRESAEIYRTRGRLSGLADLLDQVADTWEERKP